MLKDEVTELLNQHQKELSEYSVKTLALFGSVARGEDSEESDVDILVEFEEVPDLFAFIRFKWFLEEILNHKVDLVTYKALHPALRDNILNEAEYAYPKMAA